MCTFKMRHNEETSLSGIRKNRDGTVDFGAEILPVTCKEMMGMLIKRKFERGRFQGLF